MLVTDFLDKNARIYPNKVAIVFEGRRYTYAELARRVNSLANSLERLGLNKGDRVSVLDSNSLEFVEIYYGALNCGAIVAPVNWRLSSGEICQIINEVGSKIL